MDPIVIKINQKTLDNMFHFYHDQILNRDFQHTHFVAKTEECTITVYKSMKAMFQGKNAINEASIWKPITPKVKADNNDEVFTGATYTKTHIGSDEVGTGDYFGPICVVACFIDEKDSQWLLDLGIQDSKNITDKQIIEIGKVIKDKLIYSLLILDNEKYNDMISKGMNQANIKARLHNLALLNVSRKVNQEVALKVVDQFVVPKTYFNYLKNETLVIRDIHFETKAESKYLAVACASILARFAFLHSMAKLSKDVGMTLPKGAGNKVDDAACELIKIHGDAILNKVAKFHFANTSKVYQLFNH